MKLKVRLNDKFRVEDIERDDKSLSWIEKHQLGNQNKLPVLPKRLHQLCNIRDEKGYRSLHNSKEDLLVSDKLEVIPISGQQWQAMTNNERAELLELVEFTGKDPTDYVRSFEVMYPYNPDFSKRK